MTQMVKSVKMSTPQIAMGASMEHIYQAPPQPTDQQSLAQYRRQVRSNITEVANITQSSRRLSVSEDDLAARYNDIGTYEFMLSAAGGVPKHLLEMRIQLSKGQKKHEKMTARIDQLFEEKLASEDIISELQSTIKYLDSNKPEGG